MPAFLVPFRLPLLLALAYALAAPAPPFARQARAAGAIDVDVTLPTRPPTRQGDRYVSSTGEARNTQDVPAVVYIAGPVAGAPEARPSGLELAQRGEAFRPTMVVVPVGARVTFPNGDNLFHNVFSYSRPKRFDLGRYPRGEAKTVVFDKPGYVKVLCEVHKWMRAGVLVVENPYYARVEASGRVRLEDVPPGRYTVVVETFERRAQASVEVSEGATARVALAP
jgi:plastocyanin